MSSYALCTVVLSAEGQVSGADLRHVSDRCGSLWRALHSAVPPMHMTRLCTDEAGAMARRKTTPSSVRVRSRCGSGMAQGYASGARRRLHGCPQLFSVSMLFAVVASLTLLRW